MFLYFRSSHRLQSSGCVAILLLFACIPVCGQAPTCPAVADRPVAAADTAYSEGRYADAEGLYQQALVQNPQDAELAAALVRTLLHENKVTLASTQATAALAANPHAAAILTVLAEVQLRQG